MIVSDINNEEVKYLLEKKSRVGGENLIDANASFDPHKVMQFLLDLIQLVLKNLVKLLQKILEKDLQ